MERKDKITKWIKRTEKRRKENKIILIKRRKKEICLKWEQFGKHMLKIVRKKKKKSHTMARLSTLLNDKMKDLVNKLDIQYQPAFEECDRKMKMKIFEYEGKKSFISGTHCNGVGDHMIGIREEIKAQGIAGSNSQWNTIPLTHKENVSYKRAEIKGIKKNLASDLLTDDEILLLTPNQKKTYNKLNEWKKYVKSRNARMFYSNMKIIDDENEDVILNTLSLIENHTLKQKYTM